MATFFGDTSALCKRYVQEAGSAWLRKILDPEAGNEIFIVRLTAVELIAAVTRREKGGSLSAADASNVRASFKSDLSAEYQVAEITAALAERAMALAEKHALRASDAVQLAAAKEIDALCVKTGLAQVTLLSSDIELNVAAKAEGMQIEDPSLQP